MKEFLRKLFKRKKTLKSLLPFTILVGYPSASSTNFVYMYEIIKLKRDYFMSSIIGKYTIYIHDRFNNRDYSYFSSTLERRKLIAVLDKNGKLLFLDKENLEFFSRSFYTIYYSSNYLGQFKIFERQSEINNLFNALLKQEIPEDIKEVKFDLF